MRTPVRTITGAAAAAALLATASPALAYECVNISKPPGAGAQVVVGPDGQIVSTTRGVMQRLERGIIDYETGDGFHGILGFDEDGDGVVDFSIYLVTPTGEIPHQAQENGAACAGIVNAGAYFACLGIG